MTDKIRIDIVSDVVCPWCIIGYKRLKQAMEEMGVEDKFEIVWNPFELNPNIASEGEDIVEHMGRKYRMSKEQSKNSQNDLAKKGEELGFKFDLFDGMKIVNTQKAHILLDFAKGYGKQTDLKLALFKAYFSERKNVSDIDTLKQIAKSVGLDENLAMERLSDKKATESIKEKEAHWLKMGVSAVPTMIFNQKETMSGAYPVGTYKQLLKELLGIKL